MENISIQFAGPSDREEIQRLLSESALPAEDVSEHMRHFIVAKDGTKLVGAVGLEVYGEAALLRSLVVAPSRRGTGLGKELSNRIVQYALDSGVEEVSLLTATAEGFFAKLGFRTVQKEKIPEYVRSTKEFRLYCPSTAVCMVKQIPR